ncbi:MAG: phage minor head protein [Candidatus Thiodiazotropha taylori]
MADKRSTRFNKELRERLKTGLKVRRDTYKALVEMLNQAEKEIVQTLSNSPTDWETFYLTQLQQQIKNALRSIEVQMATTANDAMNVSWQGGIDLVDKPIEAAGIQLSSSMPQISTNQLTAMRTFMVDRIKDVPIQLAQKITGQLGMTMMGAQSVGDTVSNVQKMFKNQGRSRILTIVRTELGRAYSTATHLRQQQASEFLPGMKKQWRRSGKVHSRVSHDVIDGQVKDIDEPFKLGNGTQLMYPRDPRASAKETINCGCESLPWMEHWDMKLPGKKPYTAQEKMLNPIKAALSDSAPLVKTG